MYADRMGNLQQDVAQVKSSALQYQLVVDRAVLLSASEADSYSPWAHIVPGPVDKHYRQ